MNTTTLTLTDDQIRIIRIALLADQTELTASIKQTMRQYNIDCKQRGAESAVALHSFAACNEMCQRLATNEKVFALLMDTIEPCHDDVAAEQLGGI